MQIIIKLQILRSYFKQKNLENEWIEKYKFLFSNDEIFTNQRMQEIEYDSFSDSYENDYEIDKNSTECYSILEEKKIEYK